MLPNILLLFFVTKVWGLQQNFIDFSLDFFTTKDVKFICLLTCGNKTWDQKFASSASKLSITMSSVSIDESSDYSDAARACLIQKYTAIGVFIDTKCPLFEDVLLFMSTPPEIFNVDMLIGSHPAAGVAIITTTSLRVLEELKHLHNIRTRYYYRIPTTGPGKFENQFLRPLTPGAWGCVTAVIILCCFVLFLTAKLERRPSSIQYAVFSVIATFCQQSRQLAVLVTGASCVLIFNYYTSSVVSWLLNGPPPSINSLEELLESSLSLIFQDIGYTRSWLQNPTYYFNKKNAEAEDKLRRYKVFNKKVGAPLLIPLDEGIEMVKAGGFAYHTEVYNANSLISKTFSQSELCELGSLESMEKTELYAAVPKDSPYKEFFNWNLLRLFETGIISRIQRGTSSPEITCGGSSPRALALGGAAPAFMLLAFGFFLSTTILLIERL
ncbi:hypothetical protein MSG28_003851 [Choristoneura fumiferana]|uniref:Uncharacterized protein n=1 Tax=Choristoneura fumiferana TaxID=7141 RepID=A0ACC0KGF8_CHOFU|nr:hypothetical protein MSG28_003851 [Choristoneura fumiferana]